MDHQQYMKIACELATTSIGRGGGPFGAVIINNDDQVIIGRGHNMVAIENDPTLHAEMVAIKNACRMLDSFKLENATLYTSCEPCPMCLSACYWAGIQTIYYGNTKDDAAAIDFDDSFIYNEIKEDSEYRFIKMVHLSESKDEYKIAFEEWSKKENKIPY